MLKLVLALASASALLLTTHGPVSYAQYPEVNQFRFVPPKGDMPVSEIYWKKVFPSSNWTGRVISLSDGCLIAADLSASPQCLDVRTGNVRGMTATESRSYNAYEAALAKYAKGVRH